MKTAITKNQIKMVHTLKNALQLDDPTYREILDTWFQAASSKDLSTAQAEVLIRELKDIAVSAGAWEQRSPREKKFDEWQNRRGDMASPPQLRKIEAMWQEVSRSEDPDGRKKALRSFLERIVKVSDLRFLDVKSAGKVINALTAMKKQMDACTGTSEIDAAAGETACKNSMKNRKRVKSART